MEHIEPRRSIKDGDYEAILRQIAYQVSQSGTVYYISLHFEILDGSLRPRDPFPDWITYCEESWSDPDSAVDGWTKMVEELGVSHREKPSPHFPSLLLGHRFRVRVEVEFCSDGWEVHEYRRVSDILGLAEPLLPTWNP